MALQPQGTLLLALLQRLDGGQIEVDGEPGDVDAEVGQQPVLQGVAVEGELGARSCPPRRILLAVWTLEKVIRSMSPSIALGTP